MSPKGGFKDPTLAGHYAGMVRGFETGNRDVGTPAARCSGNSFASAFWKGFDGITAGLGNFRDRASRKTLAYACYRAGQDCRIAYDRKRMVRFERRATEAGRVLFVGLDDRGATVHVAEVSAETIGGSWLSTYLKTYYGRTVRDFEVSP